MVAEHNANVTGIIKVQYDSDKEKPSFTKSIMTIVILLYFLGALLGGALVIAAAVTDVELGAPIDSQMFIAYAAYIGGPTATAFGFYAWKSKAENILKIQNSNLLSQKGCTGESTVDASTIVSALANMKGE